MSNQDRFSELMNSVQRIDSRKNEQSSAANGMPWQQGKEVNRGNAPTPGSIGQRGQDGGGPGSFEAEATEAKPRGVFMVIDGDNYAGSVKPHRIDGIYDYQTMLRLFAANGAA